ncbi:hypothetical protein A1E70_RS18645 [Acinetobacter baumannii]|nr:hypothetical protein [Acinetobacter baumannii]EHU2002709.1 hypothetical protein [Acinetobacter baumannii]
MGPPEAVSKAEADLWGNNKVFTRVGLLLGGYGLWIFGLSYPIYWAITQNITQAVILLFGGNIATILFIGIVKRLIGIPQVILAYIGIVLAPFLMIGIWFIRV